MSHGLNLGGRAATLAPPVRLSLLATCLCVLTVVGCRTDDPSGPSSAGQELTTTADTASDSSQVVINDSLVDNVDLALASAATGTTIYPGQDIQSKVNSYPNGTT